MNQKIKQLILDEATRIVSAADKNTILEYKKEYYSEWKDELHKAAVKAARKEINERVAKVGGEEEFLRKQNVNKMIESYANSGESWVIERQDARTIIKIDEGRVEFIGDVVTVHDISGKVVYEATGWEDLFEEYLLDEQKVWYQPKPKKGTLDYKIARELITVYKLGTKQSKREDQKRIQKLTGKEGKEAMKLLDMQTEAVEVDMRRRGFRDALKRRMHFEKIRTQKNLKVEKDKAVKSFVQSLMTDMKKKK